LLFNLGKEGVGRNVPETGKNRRGGHNLWDEGWGGTSMTTITDSLTIYRGFDHYCGISMQYLGEISINGRQRDTKIRNLDSATSFEKFPAGGTNAQYFDENTYITIFTVQSAQAI